MINIRQIIFLWLVLLGCSHKPALPGKLPAAKTRKTDTITAESQKVSFTTAKKTRFLDDPNAIKAISYSFLDFNDNEDDSTLRGQLLMIMPNYAQYLNIADPRPKVILTKAQTRKLLAIINDPDNYSYTAAFCYSPRNCFCFYDSKNEIIGWYEVCFECARIMSIPEFKLCRKGGLSDKGLNRLKQFCTAANITTGKL